MKALTLKSPAKLNLYLEVLRKRPDGYHDIETVFEKIALFDTITIRPGKNGIKITSDNPALPTGRKNLVYKAVKLLFDKTGFKEGAWIDINKNIPVASGLGGGSSNAAMALLGADRFFKLGLQRKELINLAKTLGADVPFFLEDACFAVGRERGDEIFPLYSYKNINIWHIIITFNFGISTKWVYNTLKLGLTPEVDDVKIFLPFVSKNGVENLATCLYNRLEEVVLSRFKILRTAKELLLKEGAYGAVLSGSGPTVFGIAKTREEAIAVKRRAERSLKHGTKILIVQTMKGAQGDGNHGSKDIFKRWE